MKTKTETDITAVFSLPVLRCIIALFFCPSLVFAAEPPSGPAESKTHTLFMGADISVEYNGNMYRVQDVAASAFIIKVKGHEIRVPADWSKVGTKVDRVLKLTDRSASITHLESKRAYTMGNDPAVRFQRGLASAAVMNADNLAAQSQANAGLKFLDITGMAARATPLTRGAPNTAQSDGMAGDNAAVDAQRPAGGPGSQFYNRGSPYEGEGMFDEMDVSFEVSAVEPLNNPYVVFLGQFREKEASPGKVANWIYMQPLQPITRETKKIHIEKGGFPPGFEMTDFQVHLYNRGVEIATDVAPKRVALTREEAFLYARMEYLSSHKGATLPAREFMGKLPSAAKAQLSAEQFEQPYYVKVTKDGEPAGGFLDTNCSRRVDGTVASLISNVRFYPALENGKAVEGVAELNFSRLAL